MREPDCLFGELGEVGGEDDAAGMSGPVFRVIGGVILWQMRVAGVAEDAFYEVEVGDEVARSEEANLRIPGRRESRYLW